ncbi:MAG: tetratricopeptide repeat protein [Desulforhopalus sp.]|nr:tetratricopeptide repeat protein [Desulforhopalus sp.]
MENRHSDRDTLEKLLAKTREPEAPPWLLTRIMAELDDRQPSFLRRIWTWWRLPGSIRLAPGWLAVSAVITLAAFWAGGLYERQKLIAENPAGKVALSLLADDAEANYLIGRGMLAAGHGDQALVFLGQAVRQKPGVAEFAHWQGVAYSTVGQMEKERQSYLYSVQEQPGYLPSLINLGHSYLENGEYHKALAQYEKVLQIVPADEVALYNRALSYYLMGDLTQAKQAFIGYLAQHRTGKWALRALAHLHRLGDFIYRSYPIGGSTVVVNSQDLLFGDAPSRQREARRVAEVASRVTDSELQVVVYYQGDKIAAKETAKALQEQLSIYLPGDQATRIKISWFDVAEQFEDASGTERWLATGLLIFTTPTENSKRRNSI